MTGGRSVRLDVELAADCRERVHARPAQFAGNGSSRCRFMQQAPAAEEHVGVTAVRGRASPVERGLCLSSASSHPRNRVLGVARRGPDQVTAGANPRRSAASITSLSSETTSSSLDDWSHVSKLAGSGRTAGRSRHLRVVRDDDSTRSVLLLELVNPLVGIGSATPSKQRQRKGAINQLTGRAPVPTLAVMSDQTKLIEAYARLKAPKANLPKAYNVEAK